jgi:hypothetical protein
VAVLVFVAGLWQARNLTALTAATGPLTFFVIAFLLTLVALIAGFLHAEHHKSIRWSHCATNGAALQSKPFTDYAGDTD